MFAVNKLVESAAIFAHIFVILPGRGIVAVLMIYCFINGSISRYLVVAYIIHFIYNAKICQRGGKRVNWFRKSRFFEMIKNYFPIELHQLTELSNEENYLIACHPHALLFIPPFIAFGVDAFNLERKGLRTYFTTLNINFYSPLSSEYYLASGCISASERSLKHVLNEKKGGNVVCLMVGGSEEASFNKKGTYKLLLNRRKGFCRIALETGCSLVPTITFGEIDTLDLLSTSSGGFVSKCQSRIKEWTGINPLLFTNGSILYGLPRRSKINIVMGEPIRVKKTAEPTRSDIEALHKIYKTQLKELFDNHKIKYLKDKSSQLIIV